MKQVLLTIVSAMLATTGAMAQGTMTFTTAAPQGTAVRILANVVSSTQPITIDFGNGVEQKFTIDPDQAAWQRWIDGTIEGSTITVSGQITEFELENAQLTSATIDGMTNLTELDLAKNQLKEFELRSVIPLQKLYLSENCIENSPAINPTLTLENAGKTLEWLTLSRNPGLQCLDVQYLTNLEYLTLNDCPDLASVFICLPEESRPSLTSIDLANCTLSNFYPVSLPSLRSLNLSNNRLMTEGTDNPFVLGDYPELTTLSVAQNKAIHSLDITKCTKLESLSINDCSFELVDVSQMPELYYLNIANNKIRSIDLGNNTKISTLNVAGNPMTALDISMLPSISSLNISNTQISRVDLLKAYYLKSLYASNTLLEFIDFNGLQPGRAEMIDLRNCPNFTPESMSYTLKTLPVAKSSSYRTDPNLLLEGSNAEHSNTAYATSQDMGWICDVEGDNTAVHSQLSVTLDGATDTGENKTGTLDRLYPLMAYSLPYDLDVMQTEGGKFILCQWQPQYFQTIQSVHDNALKGVPMYVYSYPEEGKRFKSVTVNGKEIFSPWFIISEPSTIKVNYTSEMASVSFDVNQGQEFSFLANTVTDGGSVWVDWGTGTRTEYTDQNAYHSGSDHISGTRIDGSAAGTRITVYGDLAGIDVSGFGSVAPVFGLWDNHILAMDLSNAPDLKYFSGYWNPIKTIDLSQNTALEVLNLSYTGLKTLDLSHNPNIIMLEAYSDSFGDEEEGIALLDAIDVSNMPYLQYLDVKGNNLSSLDVTNNKWLRWLYASNNKIPSIDVTNNTELEEISLTRNLLTSIDLSKNIKLLDLSLEDNQLTSVDLTNNTLLTDLNVAGNDIHALNLNHLSKLQRIYINGNGMTAPELNEFYYTLPQRVDDGSGDELGLSYNLAVIQGGDENLNDGTRADSSIAVDREWKPSHQGTNGGCEWAYLDIVNPLHGTVKVVDAEGNEYTNGSKVTKYLPLTIIATPDAGYAYSSYSLNNDEAVGNNNFEMPGIYTKLRVSFIKDGGVDDAAADDMTITAVRGGIHVCADLAVATVYTTDGIIAAGDVTVEGDRMIQLQPGCYIVRLNSGKAVRSAKVIVK